MPCAAARSAFRGSAGRLSSRVPGRTLHGVISAGRDAPRPGGAAGGGSPRWDPRFFEKSELFWPIRAFAQAFAGFSAWPSVDDYNRALGAVTPVRFQEAPPKPRRRRQRGPVDPSALYDARIHLEGWVPTRPRNWHDFLNMLVWAAFPRAKAELHARQHRAIAARLDAGARSLPATRTRELDGLALLDEGGLVLLHEARSLHEMRSLHEARSAPAWDPCCAEAVREAVRRGDAAVLIFGHALHESLVQEALSRDPQGLTIHAMVQPIACPEPLPSDPAARVALADERLRDALRTPGSFTHPERFGRLPVDERVLCGAR